MLYGQVTADNVRQVLPGTEMEVKCDDCGLVFTASVSDILLCDGANGKMLWFEHTGHCHRCGAVSPGAGYTF